MSLRLIHISEESGIKKFHPRISKKQWNYEKYVWAIEEGKIHNYLLPRDCPRICIDLEKIDVHLDWLDIIPIENQKAIVVVSDEWKEKIQDCTLFKYEFEISNFMLIDEIAGYYASNKVEAPIREIEVNNCEQQIMNSNVKLITLERNKMLTIKEKVVNDLEHFSIIKWNNFK